MIDPGRFQSAIIAYASYYFVFSLKIVTAQTTVLVFGLEVRRLQIACYYAILTLIVDGELVDQLARSIDDVDVIHLDSDVSMDGFDAQLFRYHFFDVVVVHFHFLSPLSLSILRQTPPLAH